MALSLSIGAGAWAGAVHAAPCSPTTISQEVVNLSVAGCTTIDARQNNGATMSWALTDGGSYTSGDNVTIQAGADNQVSSGIGGILIQGGSSLDVQGDMTINVAPNSQNAARSWWAGIVIGGPGTFTLDSNAKLTMTIDGSKDADGHGWVGIDLESPSAVVTLHGPLSITVANADSESSQTSAGVFVGTSARFTSADTTIRSDGGARAIAVVNRGSGTLVGHIELDHSGVPSVPTVSADHHGNLSITGDGSSTIYGVNKAVAVESGGQVTLRKMSVSATGLGSVSSGGVVNISGSSGNESSFTAIESSIESTGDLGTAVAISGTTNPVTLTDSQIKTQGLGATGVYVGGGGIAMSSTSPDLNSSKSAIETYGNQSTGVAVVGSGSATSTLSRTQVNIYGQDSTGIRVGRAGDSLNVTQSSVTTQRESSTGVLVDLGTLSIGEQSLITTQGRDSAAVKLLGTGNLSISDTQVSTFDDESTGIFVAGGTAAIGNGTQVETHGANATGIAISDPGASVTIASGTTIETHGQNANGFSLSGGASYVLDGNGLQLSKISSDHGALIYADGGSSIEVTAGDPFAPRASTITGGVPASWGVIAGQGGVITLDTGTSTNGNALRAAAGGTLVLKGSASAADSVVQLDGASTGSTPAPNGKLDATSHAATLAIGALTGSGDVAVSAGTAIALGSDQLTGGGPYRFSGSIIGGPVDIDKSGGNTQVLVGDQTWTGINTAKVDGGVLVVAGITDPSAFHKTIAIGNGWLDLSGTTAQFDPNNPGSAANWSGLDLQYDAGGTGGVIGSNDRIDIANGNVGYQIGRAGGTSNGDGVYVVKNNAGLSRLMGDNTYVGNTQIDAGTLQVSRDSNLGSTSAEREVRLQGGNLQVSADASGAAFTSSRELQVLQNASVEVNAGVSATFGSAATYTNAGSGSLKAGGNAAFTKSGAGSLTLGHVALTGGLVAQGGSFTANGGTISNSNGGVAISSTGGANVLLSGVAVDGGTAGAYALTSGGNSTLSAAGSTSIKGNITAAVAGANLNVELSDGATLDGVITQSGGGAASTTLADASAVWTVRGDSNVQQLMNKGLIAFGAPDIVGGVPQYKTLSVAGDYTGGGTINLNTTLNVGGAQGQQTDKVLISGNATGTTLLHVNQSGTGANTNVRDDNQAHADEGISVVQVGGTATATSFQLDRPYVAGTNIAYQYRMFAYGPGSPWGPADSGQSSLPNGDTQWDYRLQTSYEDNQGNVIPGMPKNGPSPSRPLLVPQASAYLITPLVLQQYSATLMTGLHSRLGDIRHGGRRGGASPVGAEAFARVLGDTGSYVTNLPFEQYGYGYDQRTQALQFGGNFLRYTSSDGAVFRMGVAAAIGSVHATPRTVGANNSDLSIQAQTLALTATWLSQEGWYADAVFGGSFYQNRVSSLSRSAGTQYGTGLDLALEGGRQIELPSGLMLEPRVQLLGHTANLRSMTDADAVSVSVNNSRSLTAGAGMRISYPLQGVASTARPYADIGYFFTQMFGGDVNLTGIPSMVTGNVGGAIQLAAGVTGQFGERLQAYAEINGQIRTVATGIQEWEENSESAMSFEDISKK